MPYFRALLSALTFFAGHVLNRRLDRVVLVFGALALTGVASYLILPTAFFHFAGVEAATHWIVRAPALLVVATAVASAVLTWIDARAQPDRPLTIVTRLSGAIISVFGLMVLSFTLMSLLPSFGPTTYRSSSPGADETTVYTPFHSSVHLGGHASSSELESPPRGPHALRGRIVLDGQPVDDLEVRVTPTMRDPRSISGTWSDSPSSRGCSSTSNSTQHERY